jgi:PAS domain S-box-containing protein
MLDMKTVLLSSVISNTLVTLFIALLWYRNRKRYAGLSFWLMDFVLQMAGMLLQSLRNIAPDFISIILSNTMIASGAVFMFMGLERFVGKPRTQLHNYLAVAALVGFLAYYSVIQPNIDIRTIAIFTTIAFLTVQCSWLMFKRTEPPLRPMTWSVGVVFIAYSTAALIRIVHLATKPLPAATVLFDMPTAQVVYMLIFQMLNIALTFALILMVTRRLARDVQTQEQNYASLYNSMREGMALHEIIYDADNRPVDYRVLDVNPAYETILDLKREHVIGETASNLYGSDAAQYINVFAEVATTQQPILFETYLALTDKHLKISAFSPEPGQFAAIFEDVSESKRAEEALKDSEEKFRGVFETSRDFTFISTIDGKILDNNEAVRDFFGYSFDEVRTMNIRDFYAHPEERERFRDIVVKKGYVEGYELKLRKKDGTMIDGQVTVVTRKDRNGNVIGFQGSVRDVTERRKLERQLLQSEKLSTIGTMISGIAHELNNPLTSIIGNLQLLMRRDIPDEIRGKLDIIFKESQRSARIVSGLLSFAQEHKPERRLTNVKDTIMESVKLKEYEMSASNIGIRLFLDDDLPETLCDPFQLQQVFINVINNARDAMAEKGGGILAVRTSRDEDKIVIEFEDNGPGISEERLKRIFDPFFSTKEVGKGTGLGLSMAYGIIKEHGGTISVDSQPGTGTTFTIMLPILAPEEKTEITVTHDSDTVQEHALRAPKSILLVDDEDGFALMISEALSNEGYHVDNCKDSEAAIERLKKNRYDLIISDPKMGASIGEGFYQYIEDHCPSLAGRVLYITGSAVDIEMKNFLIVAGNRFIEKPFEIDVLLRTVNEITG